MKVQTTRCHADEQVVMETKMAVAIEKKMLEVKVCEGGWVEVTEMVVGEIEVGERRERRKSERVNKLNSTVV